MKKTSVFMCATIFWEALFLFAGCKVPSYPNSDSSSAFTDYEYKEVQAVNAVVPADFMRGFDASMVSYLEENGAVYYDKQNQSCDPLAALKECGVNWVRLRLWHTPDSSSCGDNDLARTLKAAVRAKALGLKVLLDFHYSDTWADPGNQTAPNAWKNISSVQKMAAAVKEYTASVLNDFSEKNALPDMVQIGNEIESGILLKNVISGMEGTAGTQNFTDYLSAAAESVRACAPDAKIMLHMSRGGNSRVPKKFLQNTDGIDFDAVGFSYYPFFKSHGTLEELKSNIQTVVNAGKECAVVETSFAWSIWTEGKSDSTNDQLWYYDSNGNGLCQAAKSLIDSDSKVLAELDVINYEGTDCIEPSVKNQTNVIRAIIEAAASAGATGVFYWGGDWVTAASVGSPMENQALFDFEHKILPGAMAFGVQGN